MMRRSGNRIARLKRLARDASGATAVEYGLIAAGVAMAILNVVQDVGANLQEVLAFLSSAAN